MSYVFKDKNGNIIGTVNQFIANDSQVKQAIETLINEGKISIDSSETYFDEKYINLVDLNNITTNKIYTSKGEIITRDGVNLTDFISVDNETIYHTNCYCNSALGWDQKVFYFDKDKNFLSDAQITEKSSYGIISISSTCTYIRISYANTITPCLITSDKGTDFETYINNNTKEIDIKQDYKKDFIENLLDGVKSDFLQVLQRMSNPLFGKKAIQIGDSNTQYMGDELVNTLAEKKGITLNNFGTAGATWEVASGEDNTTTANTSAVGKVNQLIANANSSTKLCTDYDMIIIMMGTNCNTEGELTDTSSDVTTMCGAIRYCLEKLCYYYRKSAIGVILPPQRADGDSWQEPRNEKIKSICGEYGVPTLDLYHCGRIIPDSKTPDGNNYYLNDGLHFGDNGKPHFYRIVGAWLETI